MTKQKWIVALGGLFVGALLIWWLWPSGTPEPEVAAPAEAGSSELAISADQAKALSLRFAPVAQASMMPIAILPAMIVPPPNSRVAVAAPLPGVVTRVMVVEGDAVRAGQALATVASPDMVGLSADLARANARLEVAKATAGRMAQLSKEGIVAPARNDEAQAALRQAQVDVSEQARRIGLANGGANGSGYTLKAPIGGRVSHMAIETGKALDPSMAPFVIDAAGPVQAQAQLPERLIGAVTPGMTVTAGAGVEGKVLAVGSALDPATRSAMLTAQLPASASIRAGQALSLAVQGPAPAGAVRVPDAALAQLGGENIVFVQTAHGVMPRTVKPAEGGTGADGERVILSGLKPGESVAVSAVSELKALAAAQ